MEEEPFIEPSSCNLLKEPISWIDLLEGGTSFELKTNLSENLSDDIFDEMNGDQEDDEDDVSVDPSTLASPWTRPFDELREQMTKLDDRLYKRIINEGDAEKGLVKLEARVKIRYSAYFEGESTPFDSSYLRGNSFQFYTGRNEVLGGLEAAVLTMHVGEHAQFVISYELLFREMGCPPRIKRRADGLFIIQVIAFHEVGDMDAEKELREEDRNKYSIVFEKVKKIHLKGLDFFRLSMYKNACRAFEKAVDVLNFCQLANDEEQKEHNNFLIKLYCNLALCYLKLNAPGRTCIMCKEIRRLTGNKPPCKALFQEGRALHQLGDYAQARHLLISAQAMQPQNCEISKELKTLDERFARYKQNEKDIWQKAIGIFNSSNKTPPNPKDDAKGDEEFESCMTELIQSFKNNLNVNTFDLPSGLTSNEIDTVNKVAKRMEVQLHMSPLDINQYTLRK